jgi:hypothetical protein
MLTPLDNYYNQKEEPVKSCLQFLRQHIPAFHPGITEALKYGMPFFCYKGKMTCYLWTDKKTGWPYLGIVEGKQMTHPELIADKRARMKIWMIDPAKDVPVKKLNAILKEMMKLYKD